MVDAGLIVLVSFISPFRSERQLARDLLDPGEFIEVFVDATLEVAESRDRKGLYAKARRGELTNFTGIDSPYEEPENPEIHLDTSGDHDCRAGSGRDHRSPRQAGILAPRRPMGPHLSTRRDELSAAVMRRDLNIGTTWLLPDWSQGPSGDEQAVLEAVACGRL